MLADFSCTSLTYSHATRLLSLWPPTPLECILARALACLCMVKEGVEIGPRHCHEEMHDEGEMAKSSVPPFPVFSWHSASTFCFLHDLRGQSWISHVSPTFLTIFTPSLYAYGPRLGCLSCGPVKIQNDALLHVPALLHRKRTTSCTLGPY